MPSFTVFYRHPLHGAGSYGIERADAATAGTEAVDMLAEDFASDEDEMDEAVLDEIRMDLQVEVYAGKRLDPPTEEPAWSR